MAASTAQTNFALQSFLTGQADYSTGAKYAATFITQKPRLSQAKYSAHVILCTYMIIDGADISCLATCDNFQKKNSSICCPGLQNLTADCFTAQT